MRSSPMTDATDTASLAEHRQRVKMLNAIYAVYERRAVVQYSQARPSQLLRHGLPVRLAAKAITRADCSGLAALGLDWAGIQPIAGRRVDWRYVNTWVLLRLFGHEVPLSRAEPGDLVFYGPSANDPHHVAILRARVVTEHHPAPLTWTVYTNGHHPMSIEPVRYRPDLLHVRSVLP